MNDDCRLWMASQDVTIHYLDQLPTANKLSQTSWLKNNSNLLSSSSGGQMSELHPNGLNSRGRQDCVPSGYSRRVYSLTFTSFQRSPASMVYGLSSNFKTGNIASSKFSDSSVSFFHKNPCDYVEFTRIISSSHFPTSRSAGQLP